MIVLIVTPTRNVEKFLDETIFSVVSQVGDFDLSYHIQDSQSSDSTVNIIKKWERILAEPRNPFFNPRISFSWTSESDQGMYDAINRGFEVLIKKFGDSNSKNTVMSWINGDDIFTHGSLQTAVSFFRDTDYSWITGVPSLVRHDSVIMEIRDYPCYFSRHFLEKGLYDGRHFQFVQQEGTFWRRSLWEATGSLDLRLKLAGDWDLWRRFAQNTDLVTLSAVLGLHRRRFGQLSSTLELYHKEVDDILTKQNFLLKDKEYLDDKYFAFTARWNLVTSQWQIDTHEVAEAGKKTTMGDPQSADEPTSDDIFTQHAKLRTKLSANLQTLKFELSKAKPDIIVSHCEVNDRQEVGALLKRIFPDGTNILSLRSANLYGGSQNFGYSNICLKQADKTRKEMFSTVNGLTSLGKPRQILSVPYFAEDVVLTLALKDSLNVPLCTYLIDDKNIYENNIPNESMRELLEKSDLRLGISRDLCQAYEEKYALKFWFLPPVINLEFIQTRLQFERTGSHPVGVLIDDIGNQQRLNQLRLLTRQTNTRIDWYGNPNRDWLTFEETDLERDGICFKGFYSENQPLVNLSKAAYALILTGSIDDSQDRPEKLSLPSRLIYLLATANIPIIVAGSRDTAAAKFVEDSKVGLVCDYTLESFRQAVSSICSPSLQKDMRQRATKLASAFSAENIDAWIWRSLAKGMPINFKFEQLGKTLFNASAIITAVEINQLHGTGPLVKRIVEGTPNILSIRSSNEYGEEHDFGDISLLISHRGLSKQKAAENVISSLDKNTVSQILCVPYLPDDLITAITLAESQNSPLGAYIMDDQNICVNNIPDSLMREFLGKCSLRLATHPELRDAYQDKYNLEFWLLPAVVPDSLISTIPQSFDVESSRPNSGALIGSLWSKQWLDMLRIAVRDAEISLDWYGNTQIGGEILDSQKLQPWGINACGLLTEMELTQKLREFPFVIVPTGTMDDRDDRAELSRLSLPGRIIFALATSNTPVIILGHQESPAARFVERFQIGVTCGYDGKSLKESVRFVTDLQVQRRLRQNAASVANQFSAKNLNQWLWQSIQLGRPSNLRFEELFSRSAI